MVMEQHPHGVVVVIVPLPAQGHLNPSLHLTRIISARGIPVHYIGSATHNRQAKNRAHGWDPCAISNIHFHDIQLPQVVTPPPDLHASHKFPLHILPTLKASYQVREPLGVLLRALSCTNRRVVVVHDSVMSFAAEEASFVSNAEAYCLHTNSAFSFLYVEQDAFGKPIDEEGGLLPSDLPSVLFDGCYSEVFLEWAVQNFQWMEFDAGNIYNTCDTIEGRIIDLVAQLQQNKKHWAIGAFNPTSVEPTKDLRHPCLEWLDKHPENSVIYVSFGTTTTVNDEQIAEIATGLEHSKQRFIWVLRDADRGNIFEGEERKAQLPNGFEERTQGVGMIVRDWAPQLEILAHSSTGGFMSHCGWNSCLESMSMGVPIAAWPMHSDQPRNAVLVSDVLKVGLLVREWARQEELISADIIQRSIRKLMSEEGNMMRKRADELGIAIRRSVSEGGSTMTQLESFLTHISRS